MAKNSTINSEQSYLCLDAVSRPSRLEQALALESFDILLNTKMTHGHGVASKASKLYPAGTISLQYPHFKNLGLDLGHCYGGTVNLSIAPARCTIHKPSLYLQDVDWYPSRGRTENFLICDCAIKVVGGYVLGYIYQPDIKTKIEHYDDPHALQVISPFIEGLQDSENISLYLKSSQCSIEE